MLFSLPFPCHNQVKMRATTATVLTVAIGAANAQSLQCAQGVHIIAARGTGEKEGPGVSGELADRVIDRIRGSEVDGLDYPATLTDPDYLSSAKDGAEELREVVRQYAEDCPDTKIVVIGYSQGAQVATNTFCGGGGDGFGNEDALPENLVEDHGTLHNWGVSQNTDLHEQYPPSSSSAIHPTSPTQHTTGEPPTTTEYVHCCAISGPC